MSVKATRGDTIVEVIVAFTIFAMAAVAAVAIMNRGIAMSQRSLEITLVRQQIDSQADVLRFARDNKTSAWTEIKARSTGAATVQTAARSVCPKDLASLPNGSFYLNPSQTSVDLVKLRGGLASSYSPAETYARVGTNLTTPKSYGLWIQPIRVDDTTFDMYINACWDTVGSEIPQTLRTIVRLYES